MDGAAVLVQVVPAAEAGREIGWGQANVAEALDRRLDDIRQAIASGARAVADALPSLPRPDDWELSEVSAAFGLTLTAEAGALLTRASAGATFDVTVTFTRDASGAGHEDSR